MRAGPIAPTRGRDFTCLKCGGISYTMKRDRGAGRVPVCRGCRS